MDTLPAPPSDLISRGRGRRFWRSVLTEHELRTDEMELLAECCRMLDLLDGLRDASKPLVIDGRMNPAIVEARQVRQEFRRALAQLCLEDPPEEGGAVAVDAATLRSAMARKAARARWDRVTP